MPITLILIVSFLLGLLFTITGFAKKKLIYHIPGIILMIISIGILILIYRSSMDGDSGSEIIKNHLPESMLGEEQEENKEDPNNTEEDISVVLENLEIPWEVAFLPNKDMLVTERGGELIFVNHKTKSQEFITIPGVEEVGEGGLLGLTVHPNYKSNNWIYIYLTTRNETNMLNRVERYNFDGKNFFNRSIILDNIPAAKYHNGGRIAFGPDGYLYITTGDANDSNLAQDTSSLAGKILRIADDGSAPADNPFGNEVWSYGHRNPQGLAWDKRGNLWSTEHGRSGALSGFDELNLIKKGLNYGWPTIQGDETIEGMETPVAHSGPNTTWAPAGLAYIDNSLFFTGLRGNSIYQLDLSDSSMPIQTHDASEFGRLRAIVAGPDEYLYISTSNKDGRGNPKDGDDKIIKIDPKIFN